MRSAATFGLILLLGACGGGSGGGLGARAITAEEADPLCRADCQHDIDCGFETDLELCTDNCVADVVGWARGDVVETILECQAGLACGVGDDECIAGIRPLAIHEEWEAKCRPAMMGCLGDPADEEAICESTPNATNDAGFISVIAPELMPAIIACLDGADCAARLGCLMAEFEAHNIDF